MLLADSPPPPLLRVERPLAGSSSAGDVAQVGGTASTFDLTLGLSTSVALGALALAPASAHGFEGGQVTARGDTVVSADIGAHATLTAGMFGQVLQVAPAVAIGTTLQTAGEIQSADAVRVMAADVAGAVHNLADLLASLPTLAPAEAAAALEQIGTGLATITVPGSAPIAGDIPLPAALGLIGTIDAAGSLTAGTLIGVTDPAGKVGTSTATLIDATGTLVTTSVATLGDVVQDTAAGTGALITAAMDTLANTASAGATLVTATTGALDHIVQETAATAGSLVGDTTAAAATALGDIASTAAATTTASLQTATGAVADLGVTATDGATTIVASFADTAGDTVDDLLGGTDPAGGIATLTGLLDAENGFAIGEAGAAPVFASVGPVLADTVEDAVDFAPVADLAGDLTGALGDTLLPDHHDHGGGLLGGLGLGDHHG